MALNQFLSFNFVSTKCSLEEILEYICASNSIKTVKTESSGEKDRQPKNEDETLWKVKIKFSLTNYIYLNFRLSNNLLFMCM